MCAYQNRVLRVAYQQWKGKIKMAENSNIEWTTHTFNPWIGCTKISPACDFCYAEAWDARGLHKGESRWGPHAARTRTKTWGNPVKWNKQSALTGDRPRVFCASLADVGDNHASILPEWRDDLWALIRATPNLDWLLLTKRPQNLVKYLPADWGNGYPNVWVGCTAENQAEYDRRKPALLAIPAVVRFLSMEPLLGPVDMGDMTGLHWIITGGENGPKYRHAEPVWFRGLRDQCAAARVPFLFKQWEGPNQKAIKALGRTLDGVEHNGYPVAGGFRAMIGENL
jgi:protein gp37